MGTKTLVCAACGAALERDPDDDAMGDGGRPICGECARARVRSGATCLALSPAHMWIEAPGMADGQVCDR